jgi:putative transposase
MVQTGISALNSRLERSEKAMKVPKFSFSQKAFILKQGDDGVPVAEICRYAGISQVNLFQLTQEVWWLLPDEFCRL